MNKRKVERYVAAILPIVLMMSGCTKEKESAASAEEAEIKRIALDSVTDLTVEYSDDSEKDAVELLKENLTGNTSSSNSTDEQKEGDAEDSSSSDEDQEKKDTVTVDGQEVTITADPKTVDLTSLGTTSVTYTFAYAQTNANQAQQKKVNITIKDTQAPIIHASHQYEVRLGQTFYPDKVIAEVKDPVDGPLKKVDSEPEKISDKGDGSVYREGWYTVEYSVNTARSGTYNMHIHAVDKHGLSTDDNTISIIVNSRYWSDSRYTATPTPTATPEESEEPEETETPEATPETPAESPAEETPSTDVQPSTDSGTTDNSSGETPAAPAQETPATTVEGGDSTTTQ